MTHTSDFPDFDSTPDLLKERVIELNWLKGQIAEYMVRREELEKGIIELLGHKKEGQKTYSVNKFKVTVKTGFNYSLDKAKYLELSSQLPAEFNPVTEKIAYHLNTSLFKLGQKTADKQTKSILKKIVSTSDKKVVVTITSAD